MELTYPYSFEPSSVGEWFGKDQVMSKRRFAPVWRAAMRWRDFITVVTAAWPLAAVRAAAAMPAVGFLGSSSQAACKKLSLRFLKHLSPAGLL